MMMVVVILIDNVVVVVNIGDSWGYIFYQDLLI